jgi:uncharacterized protein (DUF58 family)
MLTSRAWWFLLTVGLVLFLGILGGFQVLILVGLTLWLWFGAEWLLFAVRARSLVRVTIEREVRDDRGAVTTLWVGHTFEVRVKVRLSGLLSLAHVALADLVPFGVEYVEGDTSVEGALSRRSPLEFRYRIRCPAPGLARFEGGRVQLADLQGFFQHTAFARGVVVLRVLPALVDGEGRTASAKRHNQLPPPGIHRLRRPGSGSELLDLRDYLPGDPPRTIAWKVSARRDRLITKEFESEVPVRCTLFVDTSNSVRVPSVGGRALTRLLDVSAGVLQASHAIRDLTGLCLFDEHGVTAVRPDRTGSHLTQMLQMLADAAALGPKAARVDPGRLAELANAFAEQVYPELMRPRVNALTFWFHRVASAPGRQRRRRTFLEYLHHVREPLLFLTWGMPLFIIGAVVLNAPQVSQWFPAAAQPVLPYVFWLTVFLWLLVSTLLPWAFLLDSMAGVRIRRRKRWRKRLAALLSVRYGLLPGGLATLLEDDDQFVLLLQRFLAEHQVPYSVPLYDNTGRYLFAAPEKIGVLSSALLRAVGKGHDNELFVLMVDLLELDDHLDPLLKAVRVAVSRHHQVILVCPWPPGLPPPGGVDKGLQESVLSAEGRGAALRGLVRRTTAARFRRAYQRVRRAFTRMGVSVVCAASDEPVPLILNRLDRLRAVGRGR